MNTTNAPVDNVRGAIFLTLGFAAFIPIVDAAAKTLGHDGMGALQIAWSRFAIQIILVGPLMVAAGGQVVWSSRTLKVFALRGLFITFGNVFLFAGLAFLPIADSVAIFFICVMPPQ